MLTSLVENLADIINMHLQDHETADHMDPIPRHDGSPHTANFSVLTLSIRCSWHILGITDRANSF